MASSSLRWVRAMMPRRVNLQRAGQSSTSQANFSTTSTLCQEASSSSSSSISGGNSMSRLPGSQSLSANRGGGGGSRSMLTKSEPYNLHIQCTRNNTILTLTTPQGAPVTRVSSGMCGFKKSGRSGYEAGHQSAIRMFGIIGENQTKWRLANLNLIFKGFGLGRDAVHRALLTDEGTQVRNLVRKLNDATRIRVGGCRPKKRRML